ncbi:unnamed protein product [Spirodela intermedia]|uniref:Uncharacterized protein n=1 Tax=Spirodela intermedia TaxID=51605 RepID=A0A7I8LL64_SPIIN|nr:unnamed protein product [Spirodela intermedia]
MLNLLWPSTRPQGAIAWPPERSATRRKHRGGDMSYNSYHLLVFWNARGHRIICSATVLDHETLQWVSSISCLVLMLAKGTAIQKSFLAPLFTLQAPASILSWIRGDYGISAAFIALLVRLFYYIPAELDLPFLTALLVIVTPYQAAGLRGTQIGAVISLVIAGYLAFQHFSRAGTFQKAFDQGSIVATLAIVFITAVPFTGLF